MNLNCPMCGQLRIFVKVLSRAEAGLLCQQCHLIWLTDFPTEAVQVVTLGTVNPLRRRLLRVKREE